MPRGVAIPEIRQHLFAALERVIVRDGPGKLSGRAVTGEAGVATGLLYSHFTDLDAFLAAYAVDRAFAVAAECAPLPERAGTGEVAGNLCDTVLAIPLATVIASTRLLVARPELVDRVQDVLGEHSTGLDALESSFAAYLSAEQLRDRLPRTVRPEALAAALVGIVQYRALTDRAESETTERIRRSITALVDGYPVQTPPRRG
ncbi:TetR/AcrR family transcriptional regulator [Nocardia mexicana]|uniref:TetR/AcrR family transcriptional regulator n=1 Tax=Nocardia mexicana TaxID=279262 RepID=UPI000836E5F5|nr:TetR/AcrR family transcriptional regulator [Nocardia mexicana]